MTLTNLASRYGAQPTETQMRAMARLRAVYGVWRVTLDAKQRTLRIEYDASRLSERMIAGLLRNAGIDLLGKLVATSDVLFTVRDFPRGCSIVSRLV